MTAPDPLREDEVEAVIDAILNHISSEGPWYNDPKDIEAAARAAILRLDEVRNAK